MVTTNDGFEIAEVDLKLRGPGDLTGTQQSGLLQLKIADIVKDGEILRTARHQALQLIKEDPSLQRPENAAILGSYARMMAQTTLWNYIS